MYRFSSYSWRRLWQWCKQIFDFHNARTDKPAITPRARSTVLNQTPSIHLPSHHHVAGSTAPKQHEHTLQVGQQAAHGSKPLLRHHAPHDTIGISSSILRHPRSTAHSSPSSHPPSTPHSPTTLRVQQHEHTLRGGQRKQSLDAKADSRIPATAMARAHPIPRKVSRRHEPLHPRQRFVPLVPAPLGLAARSKRCNNAALCQQQKKTRARI